MLVEFKITHNIRVLNVISRRKIAFKIVGKARLRERAAMRLRRSVELRVGAKRTGRWSEKLKLRDPLQEHFDAMVKLVGGPIHGRKEISALEWN